MLRGLFKLFLFRKLFGGAAGGRRGRGGMGCGCIGIGLVLVIIVLFFLLRGFFGGGGEPYGW